MTGNDMNEGFETDELTVPPTNAPADTEAEAIARYLQANPAFLIERPDVLRAVELPHQVEGAVSLVERQVAQLRAHNGQLERRLRELVSVAQANEALSEQIHALALALLCAPSADASLALICARLREDFAADAVRLLLRGHAPQLRPREELQQIEAARSVPLDQLRLKEKPRCGRIDPEIAGWLFGAASETVASAALIPLQDRLAGGVLAIGSQDPERFRPRMGTLFLSRLGQLVETALACHLDD